MFFEILIDIDVQATPPSYYKPNARFKRLPAPFTAPVIKIIVIKLCKTLPNPSTIPKNALSNIPKSMERIIIPPIDSVIAIARISKTFDKKVRIHEDAVCSSPLPQAIVLNAIGATAASQ